MKRGLASALPRPSVDRCSTLFDSNGFDDRRDSGNSPGDLDRQGFGLDISSHTREFHDSVKCVDGDASKALLVRECPFNSIFDLVIVLRAIKVIKPIHEITLKKASRFTPA